jgi:hypothetical protein
MKEPSAYCQRLQCSFFSWAVNAEDELVLYLPKDNCCDMQGAIDVAEEIMPCIKKIIVRQGSVPDVMYERKSVAKDWICFDLRKKVKVA